MMRQALIAVVCVLAVLSHPAHAAGGDVVDLDPSSFKAMLASNDVWLVEFFAPWCGHCKALAPEWAKAATALKGIVKLGAVDMTVHQELGGPYGITGFPTIKIFGLDKNKPSDYTGQRTAKAIVDEAINAARSVANARLSGGKSSGGSGSGSGSGSGGKSEVVELTESNFEKLVLQSNDLWLVEFFAPWCGHCKKLEPEWKRAASDLAGKAKLGAVDATVYGALASKYGIKGYPTIKYFAPGAKSAEGEEYDGGRTASDVVQWVENKLLLSTPPPEVKQLVSQDVFTSSCTSKQLCFVLVLSNILDSSAAERNTQVELFQKLATRFRSRPFGWVWAEAGAQPAIERAANIGGSGYPSLAAFATKKNAASLMFGAYSEDSVAQFVNQLIAGRAPVFTLKEMPTAATTEPWDGKDHAPAAVVEEIDLSELDDVDVETVSRRSNTEL